MLTDQCITYVYALFYFKKKKVWNKIVAC